MGTGTFTVTRDTAPPTFTLSPAVENGAIRVTWSSTDAASGVDGSTCTLEVCEDDGAWQPFSAACAGDEVHSQAQPGHVYTFRLSASDNVSNSASTEALARFPRVTKYYYHGGQRVAMRADGVVYYLHGDHLGSTSLATNASGGEMPGSRTGYSPFGEMRYGGGGLPIDRRFTGQRLEAGLGLYDYHARFYDPTLGRFISADTIVPNPGNPQDLNRYAYVRNNPLRYVDPTGHFIQCRSDGTCYDDGYSVSNPGFTSYEADERRNALVGYNNKLYEWVRRGYTYDGQTLTDLIALAELSDYAASMIPTGMGDRARAFVYDVASVLTNQVSGVGGKYYDETAGRRLQQTGFDWVLQDPGAGGNQPHHFWFYVYQAMANGRGWAMIGNYAHETFLCRYDGKARGFVGRSYQDMALGDEGARLGAALGNGDIGIGGTGNWIQTNLSPGGLAADRWNGPSLGAGFEKKFYALSLAVAGATFFPIGEGQQGR